MLHACRAVSCGLLVLLAASCWADPAAEAQQLKDEALGILKANSEKQGTPEDYATCLLKLEKAQALVEATGDADSLLAREVSTTLFWARRFSTVQVVAALEKMKGAAGAAPAAKPVSKPAPKPAAAPAAAAANPGEPPEMQRMRVAAVAYAEAEKYAASHAGDDYAVSLGWFQMANLHPGTDYALKALEQAREAQQRFTKKPAVEELPETLEMAGVKQGDVLVAAKNYEAAIGPYKESLKTKETLIAHKRLGKAYYFRAQQLAEALKPRFEAHFAQYGAVWQGAWRTTRVGRYFETRDPGLAAWNRQYEELRKESDVAQKHYQYAEQEFKAGLKLAPDGKDFDAAGYIGLCLCVRPFFRMTGQQVLREFLKNYTPANDDQRVLYEFCKTEIERISKGK